MSPNYDKILLKVAIHFQFQLLSLVGQNRFKCQRFIEFLNVYKVMFDVCCVYVCVSYKFTELKYHHCLSSTKDCRVKIK